MFWADNILEGRTGKEWINDAWTPSGMVHMGGLKGPVIHDVLFKILKQQKKEVKFTFGFDDFDPIDGLPPELRKSHTQYLGVPIFIAPAPHGNGSFGDYYGNKMRHFFEELHIEAEIYLASDYYKKGIYNDAITYVLDHADKVRNVYEDMYKKPISKDWYPFQIVCPKCGKLGTTRVVAWDGEKVSFVCEPNLVKWAQGCNYKGEISPFNGNGKMPWKVEWAAKWATFGVTIEAAGKDHASAGGSYDVASKICEDVFNKKPPLKIPYEFFLYNGKKMSSSKGLGLHALELLEVLPREIARFLMIKSPPNQAIEFNPNETLIIPKLFDEYDRAREEYNNGSNSDLARVFELSQISDTQIPKIYDIPRFSLVVNLIQMPNVDISTRFQAERDWRGSGDAKSTKYRINLIHERQKYAKVWLEKYAPESEKFMVQSNLPSQAKNLSKQQRDLLQRISQELEKHWSAEDFQKALYEWAKELRLSSKDAFSAIYQVLIGKDHGPKAAWLILSLDRDFVKKRFKETTEN